LGDKGAVELNDCSITGQQRRRRSRRRRRKKKKRLSSREENAGWEE
jgi:hypothetical protein